MSLGVSYHRQGADNEQLAQVAMIEALGQLGLKGMAGAFAETVTTGLQRNRTAKEILADLLKAETNHRRAASIRYRLTAAKLPVMKDLAAFSFEDLQINEGLVRSLEDTQSSLA